jgi:DNA-binding beta-propeller fold protein YncE
MDVFGKLVVAKPEGAGVGCRRGPMRLARGAGCALVVCLFVAPGSALASDMLWWVNFGGTRAGAISEANLDGSGFGQNPIDTSNATTNEPEGLAIDPAANRIYWTSIGGAGTISVANLDGTGSAADLSLAGANDAFPQGLAIDPATNRMYWSNDGSGAPSISAANLDGSGSGANLYPANRPDGVAIDPAHNKIYWAEFNTAQIMVANLDGSTVTPQPLNTAGATITHPAGIAIDVAANKIYWANDDAGGSTDVKNTIGVANLDGTGSARDLVTNGLAGAVVCNPQGVAIDPAANRIFWANSCGSLGSANLSDGSGAQLLAIGNAVVSSPLYPAILTAPVGAGAPVISGMETTGSRLSCSQGSWSADLQGASLYRAPRSFAYAWQQAGADIPGAVAATYTPTQPGSYSCQVSASNLAGSTPQTSASVQVSAPPTSTTTPASLVSDTGATLNGTVNPGGGTVTDCHFDWGTSITYGHSAPCSPTPGGGTTAVHVAAVLSGLTAATTYHYRLVATNAAGTDAGADDSFHTSAVPPPVLGTSEDVKPVSGLVLVKTGPNQRFVPLTQAARIPDGSQIDATRGTIELTTAGAAGGKLQSGRFGGALFRLAQTRRGILKGLTTLTLLDRNHAALCGTSRAADAPLADPWAPIATAALSSRVLQTLHARAHGRFRTTGRFSAATVRGTIWDTTDRCDATLTIVFRGTVDVYDLAKRKTIILHARQRYLASAVQR